MARADTSSSNFVFGKLVFYRLSNSFIIRISSQLFYSRTREVVLHKFKEIGLPSSSFGLYFLRIVGATAAASRDVSLQAIKEHGRWKSDKSKDLYCRSDLKHQLTVSLNNFLFLLIFVHMLDGHLHSCFKQWRSKLDNWGGGGTYSYIRVHRP